jgi:hypothetical protein
MRLAYRFDRHRGRTEQNRNGVNRQKHARFRQSFIKVVGVAVLALSIAAFVIMIWSL